MFDWPLKILKYIIHQRSDPHVSYILVLSFPSFFAFTICKSFCFFASTIFGTFHHIWGYFGNLVGSFGTPVIHSEPVVVTYCISSNSSCTYSDSSQFVFANVLSHVESDYSIIIPFHCRHV